MEKSIWEKPISHGELLKKIWKHLDLGVIDRDHPFHLPVFATLAVGKPAVRVVTLRRFWRKNPRGAGKAPPERCRGQAQLQSAT